MQFPKNGEIASISDAVEVVRTLERDVSAVPHGWPFHKFPFGLWFRGQSQPELPLIPRVHRRERVIKGEVTPGCWDETNIFEHLKVRAPSHQLTYHTAFDWLCLMQHYSIPTRLLDWSEYILPALYFAVKDDDKQAGELIVLNARCLNEDKNLPSIFPPNEAQVVIRAEMAWTRQASKHRHKQTVVTALAEENISPPPHELGWLEQFTTPIAVFPSRLNDRMVFQSSVFTLHGGKEYPGGMRSYYRGNDLPGPVTLDQIDQRHPSKQILRRYTIPSAAKKEILHDLSLLGIHEATLFPEVDRQAVYLEELWWHSGNPADAPSPVA